MRINREIRADSVRLIGSDGKQIGIVSIKEALHLAEKEGLDLVEVVETAKPPVCRVMNLGKYRYQQTKKEREGKKAQHQIKVKEIKLKPNIDVHDFNTKLKHVKEFLLKGNKVRITCTFRGREMLHMELGEKQLERMREETEDIATMEAPPKRMGKTMNIVLAPIGKKDKKK